ASSRTTMPWSIAKLLKHSVIGFVQIGDLEPDHRGRKDPRPPEVVEALFEGLYELFERLRLPGPEGLPRPEVMLFTGDLSVGMPSRAGAKWRRQYEGMFEIWRELGREGCSIVWTIALHERDDFHRWNWPFGA